MVTVVSEVVKKKQNKKPMMLSFERLRRFIVNKEIIHFRFLCVVTDRGFALTFHDTIEISSS